MMAVCTETWAHKQCCKVAECVRGVIFSWSLSASQFACSLVNFLYVLI